VVDPEIVRWLNIGLPYTTGDAERFIAGATGAWLERRGAHFAVVEAPDGPLLGYLGVLAAEAGMQAVEIVYWVAAFARGRGAAKAALRLALDWIPAGIGSPRVELGMVDGNEASARVAEACGFVVREVIANGATLDGRPVDERIYELRRTD
jgi:RimJ/RimL family protein N-acetyltransferase